jgi:hypothetical protein
LVHFFAVLRCHVDFICPSSHAFRTLSAPKECQASTRTVIACSRVDHLPPLRQARCSDARLGRDLSLRKYNNQLAGIRMFFQPECKRPRCEAEVLAVESWEFGEQDLDRAPKRLAPVPPPLITMASIPALSLHLSTHCISVERSRSGMSLNFEGNPDPDPDPGVATHR